MADFVSHPDEVKVISKRFGKGATNIDRYLELDGYKARAEGAQHDAGRHHQCGESFRACAAAAARDSPRA